MPQHYLSEGHGFSRAVPPLPDAALAAEGRSKNLIAFLTLELRIEAAHSLKDKRQVVRSLKDRLRAHFNVSVAEMDANGLWQRATIGVVSISDSRDYLTGLMNNVERQAMRIANNAGADVADSYVEYL